jgi:hypothetical protein
LILIAVSPFRFDADSVYRRVRPSEPSAKTFFALFLR